MFADTCGVYLHVHTGICACTCLHVHTHCAGTHVACMCVHCTRVACMYGVSAGQHELSRHTRESCPAWGRLRKSRAESREGSLGPFASPPPSGLQREQHLWGRQGAEAGELGRPGCRLLAERDGGPGASRGGGRTGALGAGPSQAGGPGEKPFLHPPPHGGRHRAGCEASHSRRHVRPGSHPSDIAAAPGAPQAW